MSSYIYFYSKFTEEFLLLGGAGIFTLLSLYCYHWVVRKRRLGAARDMVPAGMVKVYLGQLIDEAQFVRTQLFGLLGNTEKGQSLADFEGTFAKRALAPAGASGAIPSVPGETAGGIPEDLLARLHSLEEQLSAKEGMVVNINVEKSKLLEEVENLRQNQHAVQTASAATGNNDDLLKKIKALEERLEEYAMFEDDLANLKRLQQENTELKKKLDIDSDPTPAAQAAPVAPTEPTVSDKLIEKEAPLDNAAVSALLKGESPIPPTQKPADPLKETAQAASNAPLATVTPIAPTQAAAPAVAEAPAAKPPTGDAFEKLVDSVETSLDKPAAPTPAAAPATAAAPAPASSPPASVETLSQKTDEELLKEFENLLNS